MLWADCRLLLLPTPDTAAELDQLLAQAASGGWVLALLKLGRRWPWVRPLLEQRGLLEQALGREAIRDLQPMQPGDVPATAADTSALEAWVGFRPTTAIEAGVERFATWYREFNAG